MGSLMNALTFPLINTLYQTLPGAVGGAAPWKKDVKEVVIDNGKQNAEAYGGKESTSVLGGGGGDPAPRSSSPGGPANISTHYMLGRTRN